MLKTINIVNNNKKNNVENLRRENVNLKGSKTLVKDNILLLDVVLGGGGGGGWGFFGTVKRKYDIVFLLLALYSFLCLHVVVWHFGSTKAVCFFLISFSFSQRTHCRLSRWNSENGTPLFSQFLSCPLRCRDEWGIFVTFNL